VKPRGMGLIQWYGPPQIVGERDQMRKEVREVAYLLDHLLGGIGGGLGQRGAGQHATVTFVVQLHGDTGQETTNNDVRECMVEADPPCVERQMAARARTQADTICV
jgi:hypothetical protein